VSFGPKVGIGNTLQAALDVVLGATPSTEPGGGTVTPSGPGTGPALPTEALQLLQQADAKFRAADAALKAGDLQGYAKAVDEGRALVERALATGTTTKK
jgi:hypothetical protein